MSSSIPSAPVGPSKVAIPRLLQKRSEPPRKVTISRGNRVDRACMSCRTRKIRCNAAKPRCANCSDNAPPCVYISSRRDRLKIATGQNQDMVALLRDLREQVSDGGKHKIDDMLASVVDDIADAAASVHGSQDHFHEAEEREGTLHAHTQNRPLDPAVQDGPPPLSAYTTEHPQASSLKLETCSTSDKANFFLDDIRFEPDLEIDPSKLPPFEDAEKLFQAYIASCHNSFPLLAKKAFTHQFYHYYAALKRGEPYNLPHTWQIQLQVVFAIGAHYTLLTSGEGHEHAGAHTNYHSRAWALSLNNSWWASEPDLAQMQIAGLFSLYYLGIGRINRSWTLIGIALRIGYALGLHMRNDFTSSAVTKEVLSRIWWAHYSLEALLAAMTGRPSIGLYATCTVPLPLPVPSEEIEETIIESRFGDQKPMSINFLIQSRSASSVENSGSPTRTVSDYGAINSEPTNSGSYLKQIIQLGEITNDALKLYRGSAGELWQSIQSTIVRLGEELDLWATSLPDGLDFDKRGTVTGQKYERERNALEILFHGTKILITRPCLCRTDRRTMSQSARLSEFNETVALTCVESAKSIARLLPNRPDVNIVRLYEATPWWNVTHVIMQSLVVLLIALTYKADDSSYDGQEVLPSLKKLVRWLRAMEAKNTMAKRAYANVMELLRASVRRLQVDVLDLLQEDDQANAHTTSFQAPRDTVTSVSNSPAGSATTNSIPTYPFSTSVNNHILQANTSATRFSPTTSGKDTSEFPDSYMNVESYGASRSTFPTLFFTTFDQQNPLPGCGTAREDFAVGGTENVA